MTHQTTDQPAEIVRDHLIAVHLHRALVRLDANDPEGAMTNVEYARSRLRTEIAAAKRDQAKEPLRNGR